MSSMTTASAIQFGADTALVAAKGPANKAALFTANFSAEAVKPGSSMRVPIYGGTASEYNASTNNYGKPDGSLNWATVTFSGHPKMTFEFTEADLASFPSSNVWRDSGRAAGRAIGKAIEDACWGTITETAVTQETTLPATVTKAALAALRGDAIAAGLEIGRTVLVLSDPLFADTLALFDSGVYGGDEAVRAGILPGLYGFKAVIGSAAFGNAESTALPNTIGALVQDDAIVVAGRTVAADSAAYDELITATDEDSGLALTARRWHDPATGSGLYCLDCVLGAALAQADKVVRIEESDDSTDA